MSAAVLPHWAGPAVPLRQWTVGEPRRVAQPPACLQPWKRMIDVVLSIISLVILSPVIAVVAVLVKATSPGPVFFEQERIGINRRCVQRRRATFRGSQDDRRATDRRVAVKFGKPFSIYKFRTMCDGAERGTPVFAQRRDPRITRLGGFLRKTRLDEIPQFVNVLKGDMSIVGPRPERAYFIGQAQTEIPDFQKRLRTKPGITGLAQVRLGYTNSIAGLKKKLDFDLEYINRVSPATDLKILAQTVRVVLTGKGAC
jgi:lipopolysaccharide/colanic/teichoic acid biosynthesis glycosyltransferase